MENKFIERFDATVIGLARKHGGLVARLALFIVYFWFGLLKVLGLSPAEPLVGQLLSLTMPMVDPNMFYVWFGVFEVFIGVCFLIKGLERFIIPLFLFHMVTTMMPLVMLPAVTWSAPFVPTLTGQYIIKNTVLIALAITLVAQMKMFTEKKR